VRKASVLACVLWALDPSAPGATTLPDLGYVDYLDTITSGCAISIDGDDEEIAPRMDPFDGRDDSFDWGDVRITLRGVRTASGWGDLHVRCVVPRSELAPCPRIALYRSNQRIESWRLNAWGGSFRDSRPQVRGGLGASSIRLLGAQQLADSTVRLTLRARARTRAGQGRVHEFVLVFRPEAGGYRLSFVQERFDLVYDARRGTIEGTVERRIPQGDGFVLERRTVPRGERARAARGVAGLAGRLAGTDLGDGEIERALDRLAAVGQVVSRRTEARPSELLDLAAAAKK
jgi:hypothetical protein